VTPRTFLLEAQNPVEGTRRRGGLAGSRRDEETSLRAAHPRPQQKSGDSPSWYTIDAKLGDRALVMLVLDQSLAHGGCALLAASVALRTGWPLDRGVVIAAIAIAVALVLATTAFFMVQRRHRQQIDSLLGRLAELEARRAERAGTADGGDADRDNNALSDLERPPTGDVLAGRTSHVRRIVEGSGGPESLADQAIVSIHAHIEENVTPSDIADELFVSLRTLERGLMASLECTPSELILAMKMREARRLLLSGSFRVSEVASHLAFSSPSHFSRRFKSFYRVAPSELGRRSSEP
jgi:AraC-like DNA-binding protein/membrane protein implicated in regulation of membrane protease activity